ncbi:hypothetical protein ACWGCK_10950 [Streptomyces virginiae]
MKWVGDARLAAGPEATWYLETAFTPGAHLGTVYDDPTTPIVVTSVEEVTTIRVPSGRLVVDAPWDDDDTWRYERGLPTGPPRELAVRIPPGVYRVEIAWTAGPYEFIGEHFDGVECAATRLRVNDAAVVGWEMGLGVGEDIDRLPPGDRPGSALTTMSAASPTPAHGRRCPHRFAPLWMAVGSRVTSDSCRTAASGSATSHNKPIW